MATVDDLTIDFTEDDILIVKQLDKEVLTKGAWATIMYKFQQWDKKNEKYGEDKYTIRRYQKKADVYSQRSKFNISSKDQAKKIIDVLQKWTQE
ncbi:MAG TPA: hypothetical protein ENH45_04480 [Nitrospirae bacterium]|nr:hypothetical protein BMS3Abin09_01116 [bacterium BMS3Abin09]GBE41796.1 hypothetical protein BMS3Bbin09_01704 [bacterium BMS3Bbin09]HDH33849.1 hypothetical protein [Nitrospirota bacterium]HDZ84457.1 hypothetical protein [Nitrospirota bacterium]